MDYVTLTNQNQITVPMRVRDKLNLKPSDKLVFYETENDIKVAKLKSVEDFKGLLKDKRSKKTNEEYVWLERHQRSEIKK